MGYSPAQRWFRPDAAKSDGRGPQADGVSERPAWPGCVYPARIRDREPAWFSPSQRSSVVSISPSPASPSRRWFCRTSGACEPISLLEWPCRRDNRGLRRRKLPRRPGCLCTAARSSRGGCGNQNPTRYHAVRNAMSSRTTPISSLRRRTQKCSNRFIVGGSSAGSSLAYAVRQTRAWSGAVEDSIHYTIWKRSE